MPAFIGSIDVVMGKVDRGAGGAQRRLPITLPEGGQRRRLAS